MGRSGADYLADGVGQRVDIAVRDVCHEALRGQALFGIFLVVRLRQQAPVVVDSQPVQSVPRSSMAPVVVIGLFLELPEVHIAVQLHRLLDDLGVDEMVFLQIAAQRLVQRQTAAQLRRRLLAVARLRPAPQLLELDGPLPGGIEPPVKRHQIDIRGQAADVDEQRQLPAVIVRGGFPQRLLKQFVVRRHRQSGEAGGLVQLFERAIPIFGGKARLNKQRLHDLIRVVGRDQGRGVPDLLFGGGEHLVKEVVIVLQEPAEEVQIRGGQTAGGLKLLGRGVIEAVLELRYHLESRILPHHIENILAKQVFVKWHIRVLGLLRDQSWELHLPARVLHQGKIAVGRFTLPEIPGQGADGAAKVDRDPHFIVAHSIFS